MTAGLLTTHLDRLADTPVAPPYAPDAGFTGRLERQIGKRVGLTQFGVNHMTLEPGATTSRRHWHEGEDEFVFVLSGRVTLVDENGPHELRVGDYAGFPAGAPNAHQLTNRSADIAELLIVGTRKVGEEKIHYPDEAEPGPFTLRRDSRGQRLP